MERITLKYFVKMHLNTRLDSGTESIDPVSKVYTCPYGDYLLGFSLEDYLELDEEDEENFTLNLENETVVKAISQVLYDN